MIYLTNNTQNTIYLTLSADDDITRHWKASTTGFTMDLTSDMGNNTYTGITLQEIVYTGDTATRFNVFNITLTADTAVDYDNGLVWLEEEGSYHYTCYKREVALIGGATHYDELEQGKCIVSGTTYAATVPAYEYIDNDEDDYFVYQNNS